MLKRPLLLALAALSLPVAASASDPKKSAAAQPAATTAACPMTYATFEYSVPHVEVACPEGLPVQGATFCRASIANDALHVYVFGNDGAQCLLDLRSYDEGQFDLTPHGPA